MTRDGKLNKKEMVALNRAWEILSGWTQLVEDRAVARGEYPDENPLFGSAMNACMGLCEFIGCYED